MSGERLRRGFKFLSRYGYAASSAFYLFTIGVRSGRNRSLISAISTHFGYPADRGAVIPEVGLAELAPESTRIELREPEGRDGNISLYELVAICRLVSDHGSERLFEIGTFDGRTTLNLAANAPPAARVFTLDLPREALNDTELRVEESEKIFIEKETSGARYRGTECERKITQLYGDSATFDLSPFYNGIDLVFVDGSHAYEYVLSDSTRALGLLRNGKGVVLWHDYGIWDGVTRALNQLYQREGDFARLRRIAGTSLVILEAT